jgi:hypothetical protein
MSVESGVDEFEFLYDGPIWLFMEKGFNRWAQLDFIASFSNSWSLSAMSPDNLSSL